MGRAAEILVVEDNPADQRLTLEALKTATWAGVPHIVGSGAEAMSFLNRQGRFARSPKPDLVIVDLNLPGEGGHELIAHMKSDRRLRHIPVVVFSSSGETRDVSKSYGLGADCHLRKPLELDAYFRALNNLEDFWKASSAEQRRVLRFRKSLARKKVAFKVKAASELYRWRWLLLVFLVVLFLVLHFSGSDLRP